MENGLGELIDPEQRMTGAQQIELKEKQKILCYYPARGGGCPVSKSNWGLVLQRKHGFASRVVSRFK